VVNGALEAPTPLEPAVKSASIAFSPDSSKLVVVEQDSGGAIPGPSPILLYDLSEPTSIRTWTLDLPYDWAHPSWPDDSSYVGFIGAAIEAGERSSYVVDALDPERAPRLIVTCSSNPASAPGCPMSLVFQP